MIFIYYNTVQAYLQYALSHFLVNPTIKSYLLLAKIRQSAGMTFWGSLHSADVLNEEKSANLDVRMKKFDHLVMNCSIIKVQYL